MSTRISSLSMRTMVPSTTSPCLKLLMSESCSASSSSIVVGSGPVGRAGTAGQLVLGLDVGRGRRVGRLVVHGCRGVDGCSAAASGASVASSVAGGVGRPRSGRRGASAAAPSTDGAATASVSVVVPGSGLVSGAAGSSATAMAATVCSDAGASLEAVASGAGAVPPCCSSVKVILSPSWIPPLESRTAAEPRPGPSWRGRGIVGDLAGGPLLRADRLGRCSSTVACPHGPGESSTRVCVGTIAARARAARPRRRRRRVPRRPHRPIGDRRPDADAADRPGHARRARGARRARRSPRIRRLGKFLDVDLDRDRVVVNPMLTGRFQLAWRGEKAPSGTAVELTFGGRTGGPPKGAARWTKRGRLAPGRRRDGDRPLPRPDPDGQGLPAAGGRRPRGAGPRRRRDGPRRPRPGAHARGLARADPQAPGRAQEPAPQPGVRGGHRQRVLGRDPVRRPPPAVPQARRPSRPRRSTRCTRRCGRRSRRRSAAPDSACRPRSRSRSATTSRSTTAAARPARAAARGSPRSPPAGSRPRTAGAASAESRGARPEAP